MLLHNKSDIGITSCNNQSVLELESDVTQELLESDIRNFFCFCEFFKDLGMKGDRKISSNDERELSKILLSDTKDQHHLDIMDHDQEILDKETFEEHEFNKNTNFSFNPQNFYCANDRNNNECMGSYDLLSNGLTNSTYKNDVKTPDYGSPKVFSDRRDVKMVIKDQLDQQLIQNIQTQQQQSNNQPNPNPVN